MRREPVLGSLKEVFAVNLYRGAAGIGWIHQTVTEGGPFDPIAVLEGMDLLQVCIG